MLFVTVTLATTFEIPDQSGNPILISPLRSRYCAAGERRQNLNLYGLTQLLLKIFLVSHASINQYRAQLDNPVETRIRPLLAGKP